MNRDLLMVVKVFDDLVEFHTCATHESCIVSDGEHYKIP
jgi:hypothetical protein